MLVIELYKLLKTHLKVKLFPIFLKKIDQTVVACFSTDKIIFQTKYIDDCTNKCTEFKNNFD